MAARLEIEVKIPIPNPRALRARLRAQAYRPGPARPETNWLFDDAHGTLRRSGRLLRLRQSGARWLLTAKGPRQLRGSLKSRPESETTVADGAQTRALLELLGYRQTLAYARRRTLWTRPGQRGEIALDATPFGVYLELEGPPAWIKSTARALALDLHRAEPRSYPELYAAHAARGQARRSKDHPPERDHA
jgi:predicted adenylyl cyclase CyaB